MAPAVSILHLAELDAGEALVKGVAGGADAQQQYRKSPAIQA